jgi:hypothetical protein
LEGLVSIQVRNFFTDNWLTLQIIFNTN